MPVNFGLSTVLTIRNFIDNDLKEFLINADTGNYEGHLFLNPNTLKPLSAANISKIFSEITTELGWPKGKGSYSLRHKFSGDSYDKHLAIAVELGFDASDAAIKLNLQRDMTHRAGGSLDDYIEGRNRLGHKTEANKKDLQIKSLETDKTRLMLEAQKSFEIAEEHQNKNEEMAIELAQIKKEIAYLKNK